jgi:predicted metal-dependent phosphoesterase TrpH
MKIDLHIHSKSSDGALSVGEIIDEAKRRNIDFLSITDHDNIDCQPEATDLAKRAGMRYITGIELNVTFSHPKHRNGKAVPLDFLGYRFDAKDKSLCEKLKKMAEYREERAGKILNNLNAEFQKEGIEALTKADFDAIQTSVDGSLGRPHIADYLIKKGIVKNRQEAFDRYLVRCDVPKYPLYLNEASNLVHGAGGKLVLSHPNDPHGTSLAVLTESLPEQTKIVQESMLNMIDGVECWHSRNDTKTTNHYISFAKEHRLLMTGGSDCHQKPTIMGSVDVPPYVAGQFPDPKLPRS